MQDRAKPGESTSQVEDDSGQVGDLSAAVTATRLGMRSGTKVALT